MTEHTETGWEPLDLDDHDVEYLSSRAVTPEVAEARGYRTVTTKAELERLGFTSQAQKNAPTLAIPVHSPLDGGEVTCWQHRPHDPRSKGGRVLKFEWPAKAPARLDVHPAMRELLGDPGVPLLITEGAVKADAAVAHLDACTVALLGVWSWRGKNDKGGATLLADFEAVALNGRPVLVVFDSDVMVKEEVHKAMGRLGAVLAARGADLRYCYLPHGPNVTGWGLDDFLAARVAEGQDRDAIFRELAACSTEEPASFELQPSEPQEEEDLSDIPNEEGAGLLEEVRSYVARYVVVSPAALDAIVLWVAHTHLTVALDVTPRLLVTSAMKQSGKSRLLEVVKLLAFHPLYAVNASPSAVFRFIGASEHPPTILLDEVDTIWGPAAKGNEDLRGIVNSGYQRGASVIRVEGEGPNMEVREFPTFAPVALGGIGGVPDTLLDRSVTIRMERRLASEPVSKFRRRNHAEGLALGRRLRAWAKRHVERAETIHPEMPDALGDRAQDGWEPLFIVAELAGGDWPQRAVASALELDAARQEADDSTWGVAVLSELREALRSVDRISSADFVARLGALESAPWNHPLSAVQVARELKAFRLTPKKLKFAGRPLQGYTRDAATESAFGRYLPPDSPGHATSTPSHPRTIPEPPEPGPEASNPKGSEGSASSEVPAPGGTDAGTGACGTGVPEAGSAPGRNRTAPGAVTIPVIPRGSDPVPEVPALPGGEGGEHSHGTDAGPADLTVSEIRSWAEGKVLAVDLETCKAETLHVPAGPGPFVRIAGFSDGETEVVTDDPEVMAAGMDAAERLVTHEGFRFDLVAAAVHLGLDPAALAAKSTDTMLLARAVHPVPPKAEDEHPERRYTLDALCLEYLGEGKSADLRKLGRKVVQAQKLPAGTDPFAVIPTDDPEYRRYCATDARLTRRLAEKLRAAAAEAGVTDEALELEHKVAGIALRMVVEGMPVDTERLAAEVATEEAQVAEARSELLGRWLAGIPEKKKESKCPWLTTEGKEAVAAHLAGFGVPVPRTPVSGAPSITEELLESRTAEPGDLGELARTLLALMRSGEATSLARWVTPAGRVHTSLDASKQNSGRWSSTDPPLLNRAKHDPEKKERTRGFYVAGPGRLFVAADLSQVDARCVAAACGDPNYVAIFTEGRDLHSEVAAIAFGDPLRRQDAKKVSHGLNYGMSTSGLADALGTPDLDYAADVERRLRSGFPGIPAWQDKVRAEAETTGYVVNLFGRRVKVAQGQEWTAAPAALGQSSTRDLLCRALVRLTEAHPECAGWLRLSVHDEVLAEVPEDRAAEVGDWMLEALTAENLAGVPIAAEVSGPAKRWGEI